MKNLLVIEAHSDDSAIGAYGYLRKRKNAGDNLYFLAAAMSDLNFVHCGFVPREARMAEYNDYVSWLGGEQVDGFAPFDAESRMDTLPRAQIVKAFEDAIFAVKPDTLIIQGPSFHHDHTIVYEAALAAVRPNSRFQPAQILLMENPTYVHSLGPATDFKPNSYCPLSEAEMDEKINCFIDCFPSQKRARSNCLSPEGIKAWAKYRAVESMSAPYAEAFITLRRIIE